MFTRTLKGGRANRILSVGPKLSSCAAVEPSLSNSSHKNHNMTPQNRFHVKSTMLKAVWVKTTTLNEFPENKRGGILQG